jgi:bifunctional non-homologous end joining protein LigD
VGTGFKEGDLVRLADLLTPLKRKTSPFSGTKKPPKGVVFAEPKLVVEVEFANWTRTNTLRAPAYKGVRDDKDPQEVVLERA